jgi:hypothetical protein
MRLYKHTYTLGDAPDQKNHRGAWCRQVIRDDGLKFWMPLGRVRELKREGLFDGAKVPLPESFKLLQLHMRGALPGGRVSPALERLKRRYDFI